MTDAGPSERSRIRALKAQGDTGGALKLAQQLVARTPDDFDAWRILSALYYGVGDYPGALNAARKAEQTDPYQAEFRTIQAHVQRGDLVAAEKAADDLHTACPGHPRAAFTKAHIAGVRGAPEAQLHALQVGLDAMPANPMLQQMRVQALEATGAYGDALDAAQHLSKIDPGFGSVWTLVTVLMRYGKTEAALETCDRAEAVSEQRPERLSQIALVRGQTRRILGDAGGAVAAFHESLRRNPANGEAWWGLADMKTYTFSDGDKRAMDRLFGEPSLPDQIKAPVAFARAKLTEASGDWDAAFGRYAEANALQGASPFKPAEYLRAIDAVIDAFPRSVLSQPAGAPTGPVPIFIVGLPRSGSTLIEQILAAHPDIEGTIELPVLPAIKRRAHLMCRRDLGTDYLQGHRALSEDALSRLGNEYTAGSKVFRSSQSRFFTDKLPANFEHIGLIHRILPQAKIIDARRSPLDCGFSLFRQRFSQGVTFSYDLAHIGAYYRGYIKLMDHWDRALPGRVHRVQHETLVADPQREIRALLDHIGVAFDPACLSPHASSRAVRTASSEQVRQPIHSGGLGQWKRVARHLQPLRDALGAEVLSRFDPL